MRQVIKMFAAAAVAASFFVFPQLRSVACDEPEAITLLQLFRQSEAVVLARPVSVGTWANDDSEEYTRKIVLSVEKNFKGAAKKRISITEFQYFYPAADAEEGALPVIDHSLGKWAGQNQPLLLFLSKRGSDDGVLTPIEDFREGKEITPANQSIYVSRLAELKAILANKKGQNARLTEWLVALAEDPQTRWDGAEDLANSYSNLDYEANQELSEEGKKEMERIYAESGGDPVFARSLTSSQKERLINVFLGAGFDYASDAPDYYGGHDEEAPAEEAAEEEETPKREKYKLVLSEGDQRLYYLVSKFGDPRPLARVLDELPRVTEANPNMAQSLVYITKGGIEDEELDAIHQKYDQVAYQSKNDVIQEATVAYDELSADEIEAYERALAAKRNEAGGAEVEGGDSEGLPKVALKTYGERRGEIMAKIIERLRELQVQKEPDNS